MAFQFRKEAIEENLNSNFPSAEGQGNPPLYYSLSEVVVPTYSINDVSSGSALAENLQTAWDFSTGNGSVAGTTPSNFISNPGFWQVDLIFNGFVTSTAGGDNQVSIYDGVSDAVVWYFDNTTSVTGDQEATAEGKFVVFLKSGDVLRAKTYNVAARISIWYRQIATVNGTLVNPLGYSAA